MQTSTLAKLLAFVGAALTAYPSVANQTGTHGLVQVASSVFGALLIALGIFHASNSGPSVS